MDDLLKKLQDEVGLTEDQAIKAISVIKDQMEKGNFNVDWDKFFKGKYDVFLDKAQHVYQDASKGASKYADKLSGKADDLADSARIKLRDLSQKAADFFDKDDADDKKG